MAGGDRSDRSAGIGRRAALLSETPREAGEPLLSHDDVFPVPLGIMQPGTLAPVDLYIHASAAARYVLYKKARTELRDEIRQRLLDHGVDMLYLRRMDRRAYQEYVEQNLAAIIRDDLMPPEETSKLVYQSSAEVMEDVFENPRSGRNLQRAHAMVEATVLSILKNPEAIWHMTAMASHDYYTYTHCVNVSMFLSAAARDMFGIVDPRMLGRIALGGIFHDIGKSRIPESILRKPGRLTADEFERIKAHPLLGVEVVRRDRQMSHTSAAIIRSHHERNDGGGYPAGLVGEGIDRLARLAGIVDCYDALTTRRPYAPARHPFDALALMLNEMGEAQFDTEMLRQFVKFLGPKEFRMKMRARWDPELARQLGLIE